MEKYILEQYCSIFKKLKPQRWQRVQSAPADIRWIQQECQDASPFDPAGLRSQMLAQLPALVCWEDAAKNRVLTIGSAQPDANWSLALQAFGQGPTPYRICWLAHPATRQLPAAGQPVGPGAVNGGYTMPCDIRSIVIYRKEEGLRVLLHELLHARCTDNRADPVPIMEAKTEAWAEVVLCCLLARGSLQKALRLWRLQAGWVLAQTHRLIEDYAVRSPEDYAWRYTVGKKLYLEKWGLLESAAADAARHPITSRLTSPELL